MSKREKFFKKLKECLNNYEEQEEILKKYEMIVEDKVNSGQRVYEVIKSLGLPNEIALKEIKNIKKKNKFKSIIKKISKKFNAFFNTLNSKVSKIIKKQKVKKIKSENRRKFKKSFDNFKEKIFRKKKTNKNKLKQKSKSKSKKEKLELSKNTEEIKPQKHKLSWLIFILEVILFIVLFYVLVIFMASLFAFLDGVKIYGIILLLFILSLILILLLNLLNKKRFNLEIHHMKYFITFVILLIFLSLSVGYTTYDYFNIKHITDVSEKYTPVFQNLEFRFPNKNRKLHLYFNSWYDTSYLLEVDNELENKIKIRVDYYEVFYDLNYRNEGQNVYLSLAFDSRDLISMYLNNLKENKIYNEKELSRYLIKIYVSEKDMERLVVHN